MDQTSAQIAQFIVDEFLPDVASGELPRDEDLMATGVLDSFGLLDVIRWLESKFGLSILDADELDWMDFTTVASMTSYVVALQGAAGPRDNSA